MISTAIFDLETTDLLGDRGVVLCGVILSSKARKPIIIRSDETNPHWDEGRRSDDRGTISQLVDILEEHDVLVAHNGTRFDVPFLRSRMIRWGMKPLRDRPIVDPCQVAFRKLRVRNSLQALRDHLRIKANKTPLDMAVWMAAILDGDRAAMDEIVQHCVQDVRVLAEVLGHVKPYVKVLDDRGSAL